MRKGDKSVRVQLLRWWVRDRKLTPLKDYLVELVIWVQVF